jgi:hypothetical protein
VFASYAAAPPRLLIAFIDVHLRSGEQVSEIIVINDLALREGK